MTRNLLISFSLLVILTGCAVTQPPSQPRGTDDARTERIEDLLWVAEEAFKANRLTTPAEDNAYLHYTTVLAMDPGNADAANGINAIVEQYLSWAIENARAGTVNKARQYLRKAMSIDDTHPNITPVMNMIDERQQQVTVTYDLDPHAVRTRQAGRLKLDEIAGRIADNNAFITIRAPDDATGRWIYQSLNRRVSYRIEARFEQHRLPSVSLTL